LAIITSSLAVGRWPHDHVPVALQFPVPVEVQTSALTGIIGDRASANMTIMITAINFVCRWRKGCFFKILIPFQSRNGFAGLRYISPEPALNCKSAGNFPAHYSISPTFCQQLQMRTGKTK
jgi:hypothetical protein